MADKVVEELELVVSTKGTERAEKAIRGVRDEYSKLEKYKNAMGRKGVSPIISEMINETKAMQKQAYNQVLIKKRLIGELAKADNKRIAHEQRIARFESKFRRGNAGTASVRDTFMTGRRKRLVNQGPTLDGARERRLLANKIADMRIKANADSVRARVNAINAPNVGKNRPIISKDSIGMVGVSAGKSISNEELHNAYKEVIMNEIRSNVSKNISNQKVARTARAKAIKGGVVAGSDYHSKLVEPYDKARAVRDNILSNIANSKATRVARANAMKSGTIVGANYHSRMIDKRRAELDAKDLADRKAEIRSRSPIFKGRSYGNKQLAPGSAIGMKTYSKETAKAERIRLSELEKGNKLSAESRKWMIKKGDRGNARYAKNLQIIEKAKEKEAKRLKSERLDKSNKLKNFAPKMVGNAMLYMGFASMLPFLVSSVGGLATRAGDKFADVEMAGRRGRSLGAMYGGKESEAVSKYNEMTGVGRYRSMDALAQLAGPLRAQGKGLSASGLSKSTDVLFGMQHGMNMTSEQAIAKLGSVLSGKGSLKEAGFGNTKKGRTADETLENIYKFLKSNELTKAIMQDRTSMSAIMGRMRSAPDDMFSDIMDRAPEQVKESFGRLSDSIAKIFGQGGPESEKIKGMWGKVLGQFEHSIVGSLEGNEEQIAKTITTVINAIMATVSSATKNAPDIAKTYLGYKFARKVGMPTIPKMAKTVLGTGVGRLTLGGMLFNSTETGMSADLGNQPILDWKKLKKDEITYGGAVNNNTNFGVNSSDVGFGSKIIIHANNVNVDRDGNYELDNTMNGGY